MSVPSPLSGPSLPVPGDTPDSTVTRPAVVPPPPAAGRIFPYEPRRVPLAALAGQTGHERVAHQGQAQVSCPVCINHAVASLRANHPSDRR